MRVGDRYRWNGTDGGLWLRGHIYTITQTSDGGGTGRIETLVGSRSVTNDQLRNPIRWEQIPDEPEKYIGVLRGEDGTVEVYLGRNFRDEDGSIRVFPDEETAIEVMSLTSRQHPTVDYYLIPVRAVRHIRNGEVQDAV